MTNEKYVCDLDPSTRGKLILYLYKNVKNVKALREKLIAGELKCCIVKPSLVCDPFQITVAANKALLSYKANTMVTRSIYSETLYNLSISKNITQSLTKFGIDDKESTILIAIIQQDGEDLQAIIQQVDGEQCAIDDLKHFTDHKLIEKTYKVQTCRENSKMLSDLVISKIATKDFISH